MNNHRLALGLAIVALLVAACGPGTSRLGIQGDLQRVRKRTESVRSECQA